MNITEAKNWENTGVQLTYDQGLIDNLFTNVFARSSTTQMFDSAVLYAMLQSQVLAYTQMFDSTLLYATYLMTHI